MNWDTDVLAQRPRVTDAMAVRWIARLIPPAGTRAGHGITFAALVERLDTGILDAYTLVSDALYLYLIEHTEKGGYRAGPALRIWADTKQRELNEVRV
jgi:hypothetical protein